MGKIFSSKEPCLPFKHESPEGSAPNYECWRITLSTIGNFHHRPTPLAHGNGGKMAQHFVDALWTLAGPAKNLVRKTRHPNRWSILMLSPRGI